MPDSSDKRPPLPPRWVIRLAWKVHRALFRITRGRRGLWPPTAQRYGTMRVRAIGRRSGQERAVILAYLEDGPNLVTLAMNGWGEGEPAWWLNLQATPQVQVQLKNETRQVVARPAAGLERDRLWERWTLVDKNFDAFVRHRQTPTTIIVLEPRTDPGPATE
jgi:deazaflavin-dependent oxidoreductase (nitroreductase family)